MIPGLSADDTRLATFIARAETLIAGWCRWPVAVAGGAPQLESTTYTFFLDGSVVGDASRLDLPMRPIVSVTSVHDDPNRIYPAADLVPSADYEVEQIKGQIDLLPLSTHAWSGSRRSIRVIAVCGIATAQEDLKQAIAAQTKHLWDSRHTQGTVSSTQGGQSQTRKPEVIPQSVRQMVSHLRLWSVGFG